MNIEGIKIFQIDDWAYVAAKTQEDAEAYLLAEHSRPDDPEDWEICEHEMGERNKELLNLALANGDTIPCLIGVDSHYV